MPAAAVAGGDDATAAAVAAALAAAAPDPEAPLAETELDRVKLALQQVEAEREKARSMEMVDGLTGRLGLSLTDEQKKRLATELATFRDTARETMRGVRASGGGREEFTAAFDELRAGLQENLEDFLAASDSQAIASEIGNGPRGMMGGPGGPPGR